MPKYTLEVFEIRKVRTICEIEAECEQEAIDRAQWGEATPLSEFAPSETVHREVGHFIDKIVQGVET